MSAFSLGKPAEISKTEKCQFIHSQTLTSEGSNGFLPADLPLVDMTPFFAIAAALIVGGEE
jgi:hypothetical protein